MPNADRTHFDSYRLQTRVKHAILAGYLPPFFNILKSANKNLLFIDGFAGRGHYKSGEDRFDGSPLRALRLVANTPDFAARVQCIFIESRPEFYSELKEEVARFWKANASIKKPTVVCGKFSQRIDELIGSLDPGSELAPTFLFVDPCGVDDVSMDRISSVLGRGGCEAFIFFNLDGVRRILGLASSTGELSPILVDLFGSSSDAKNLVEEFRANSDPATRETAIVAAYRSSLRVRSGANYILPLRVENESRVTTSHYLLHATKHPLGFRIMKDVMWRSAGAIQCEGGALALLQASDQGRRLFRPDMLGLQSDILQELSNGPRPVSLFRETWTVRPDDMFSDSVYRRALLELEADGKIEVLSKDGRTPLPAKSRRPYKGEPSLSVELFVRKR